MISPAHSPHIPERPVSQNIPRIAFLEDGLEGGIGRVIVNLANALHRAGIGVDALLKHLRGQYVDQLDPGVRVLRIPTYHRYSGVPQLMRYVWQTPVNALIVPSERLAAIALAARRVSRQQPNIIGCVHNIDHAWLRETRSASDHKRLNRFWRSYCRCDRVVCVSDELRRRVVQETGLPDELTTTIYNPIITDEMFRLADEPLEHAWFLSDAPPVILGAGRLEYNKDFHTLITAFAGVRRDLNCRLVILGEGSQRRDLENLIASLQLQADAQLVGEVRNPYAYMRRAAVFALSSVHEGLGNVLVEALALGTPAVSTACPYGPSEILGHGRYGALVPVGDADALAAAMRAALEAETHSTIPEAAIQPFTVETSMRRYLDICIPHGKK